MTHFGYEVATAGDVNGDGYSDLVVLASGYDSWRGRAYVYHGSHFGLDVPFATFRGGDEGDPDAGSISSVSTAGDVNGDGYADLAIGAKNALSGTVYVYPGSPLGIMPGNFDIVATGEHEYDQFGSVVAPAGDVNGDGYADLAIAAGGYDTNRGKVYVYQGNDGGGREGLTRQVRGDGSGFTVQPWGPAYTADSFGVSLQAANPLGRGRARLQVQTCPPALPFGAPACLDQISDKWIESSSDGDVQLRTIVRGLEEGTLYRWRARALYDSPLYRHGPWRRLMDQALEGDVRVTRLAADLSLTKTMDPLEPLAVGEPLTFTLAFSSTGPARGVVISDILPSAFDVITSEISSEGVPVTLTKDDPCCVWEVADFESGQGGMITIPGIGQAERFVNTAAISGTSPDPDLDNNSATVQTHIPGTIFVDGGAQGGAANGLSRGLTPTPISRRHWPRPTPATRSGSPGASTGRRASARNPSTW